MLVDDVEVLVLLLVDALVDVLVEVEVLLELELLVVLELVLVVVHTHSFPNWPYPRGPQPTPELRHTASSTHIAVGYRAWACKDGCGEHARE